MLVRKMTQSESWYGQREEIRVRCNEQHEESTAADFAVEVNNGTFISVTHLCRPCMVRLATETAKVLGGGVVAL